MLRDDLHALGEAERIGHSPVLIVVSRWRGKGTRMVRTARELESALRVCRSLRGEGRVRRRLLYLEKWLDENRHVEVQAVDRYGRGVHLGERDCSVQSPPEDHRGGSDAGPHDGRLGDLADRAIRAVVAAGYENIGTLEFFVDRDDNPISSRSTAGSRSSTP